MSEDRLTAKEYRIEWIKCRCLSVVWAAAQRRLNEGRAKEIAEAFDPELFDPLQVTLPNGDGIYHVCNGQHRKRAVEMLYGPDELVPCRIAPEGDPVRAAELFLRTNTGQRPPDKIDHFKVAVTAERQTEVAIDKIVRRHNYRVDSSSAKNAISAVSALTFVYATCSPQVLDHTLEALHVIWGDDRNSVSGPLLRGFGVFLNEFAHSPDLNPKRFFEIVRKKWTPGSLLRDAKALRDLHGGSTNDAIVQLLLTHYNRGCRTGKPLKRKQST